MDKLFQVNIALHIAEPFNTEVIDISQEIKNRYKSKYYLDDKVSLPHFTLYLFALPEKNRKRLLKTAQKFVDEIEPFELTAKDIIATNNNYIMLDFVSNEKVINSHKKVLELFNPLREGAQRKKYQDNNYIDGHTPKEKEYLLMYGHRFILDNFEPHLSLAIVEDKKKSDEVIRKYEKTLTGKTAYVDTLRITEDDFETSDAKDIIFEKKL